MSRQALRSHPRLTYGRRRRRSERRSRRPARLSFLGKPADGGYRVTIEVRNARTGAVIARADLMQVDPRQVSVGRHLGGWTTTRYTSAFRYESCYQVSNAWGIHRRL